MKSETSQDEHGYESNHATACVCRCKCVLNWTRNYWVENANVYEIEYWDEMKVNWRDYEHEHTKDKCKWSEPLKT